MAVRNREKPNFVTIAGNPPQYSCDRHHRFRELLNRPLRGGLARKPPDRPDRCRHAPDGSGPAASTAAPSSTVLDPLGKNRPLHRGPPDKQHQDLWLERVRDPGCWLAPVPLWPDANPDRTVFRAMFNRRTISLIGTPSARCSRRISGDPPLPASSQFRGVNVRGSPRASLCESDDTDLSKPINHIDQLA